VISHRVPKEKRKRFFKMTLFSLNVLWALCEIGFKDLFQPFVAYKLYPLPFPYALPWKVIPYDL